MKILAFAASNSQNSINHKLVTYVAGLFNSDDVEILRIHDFEMPIFSEDREKELGQPELAQKFYKKIGETDAIIISFAEHNGSYTAAYKNLFDWTSRINSKVFQNKPMLLLSTSPGAGGARNVLASAGDSIPHFSGIVKASVSVPSFFENFNLDESRIQNKKIDKELLAATKKLIRIK